MRRCHLCQQPGDPETASYDATTGLVWCRDSVGCKARARRRLRMPSWLVGELQAVEQPTRPLRDDPWPATRGDVRPVLELRAARRATGRPAPVRSEKRRGGGSSVPVERFAAVPRRFTDALRRRELTPEEYLLGCFLIDEARGDGVVITTLLGLQEAIGWTCDSETARRRLRTLEEGGWVRCEASPGRASWTIELAGLLLDASATDSSPDSSPNSSRIPHEFLAGGPSDEELEFLSDFLAPEADDSRDPRADAGLRPDESSSPTSSLARTRGDDTRRHKTRLPVGGRAVGAPALSRLVCSECETGGGLHAEGCSWAEGAA